MTIPHMSCFESLNAISRHVGKVPEKLCSPLYRCMTLKHSKAPRVTRTDTNRHQRRPPHLMKPLIPQKSSRKKASRWDPREQPRFKRILVASVPPSSSNFGPPREVPQPPEHIGQRRLGRRHILMLKPFIFQGERFSKPVRKCLGACRKPVRNHSRGNGRVGRLPNGDGRLVLRLSCACSNDEVY